MKKLIIIFVSVVTMLFAGCNNDEFLDQPLRGRQQLDDFFENPENAENFVNGVYEFVNGNDWWQILFPRIINEMATDDNWAGNTTQPRPDITGIAAYNVFPGSTYFNSYWKYSYIGITRANIAIERIPNVDMDEALKARLIAEARFLRGWYYFDLARNFGGVPIVKSYGELLEDAINEKTRSSLDETYDFAEEDIRASIPDLPLKSEYAAKDKGRITKGAAKTLLAKIYLYREKWAESKVLAEEVIASNEYQLENSFEDIWSVGNNHGVESIFEVEHIYEPQFSGTGGFLAIMTGSRADQGWGWCVPSSDLENAFLSENDGIRLRSTIIKHGEPVFGDPDVTAFDALPSENKSGRINRKFYIPKGKRPDEYRLRVLPKSFIRLRYADLLLMHAEASFFAGDEAKAKESLKKVRDRVTLPTDMALTGDLLRDAIWKERRLELALEGQRLYDLRREKINGVPRLSLIMGPEGSFVKYNTEVSTDPFETTNPGEVQNKGASYNPSVHLLWPIPPEEIQLSKGNITQNPGY